MKSATLILALFFLLTGFIPRADYAELTKLPDLIEHFEFHKGKDNSISFFEFLQKHYASNTEHDDEHENLPFHSHHHDQCAGGVLMFHFHEITFDFQSIVKEYFYLTPTHKNFIGSYFANIWQPPCIS